MAVFTGRRTRRQMIDQALKKAGNTKILVEARVEMARLLERLYLEHEWPFLYTEASLTLTAATPLPENFLKVESSDTGLRGTSVDGDPDDWPILIVSPTEWRRRASPRDELGERPSLAMVDYSSSTIRPWPVPSSGCTALLVYKFLPPEIDPASAAAFDVDVPTFPYHGLLTDLIEQWAQEYEHNSQAVLYLREKNRDGLAMVLGIANPRDTNQAAALELDPATFGAPPRVNEE